MDLNAIEQIGKKITTTIYNALDHSITCRKDRPKEWKWFWNEELQQLADIRQQKYERWNNAPSNINRSLLWDDFITTRKNLRLAIRQSRTQQWREFCKRLQRHNPSEANSVIKRIRRNRLQPVTFSHPDGPAQAANTMVDHLSNVFGGEIPDPQQPRYDQLEDVGSSPFSIERIKMVIRKELPPRKAPGSDHIMGEMLKPITHELASILSPFLRLCWSWSHVPVAWRTAQVVPVVL